ncbi:hypothetical protein BC826DRAFT_1062381 [Russula brevipes]|nr:hypothetical protein BC826DRAFT_1062381 [Russula brevipes]
MLKGKSWGRGSGRNAGTERGRTRANEGNGSARRRSTRDGTQTKTVNWVVGSTTLSR